jgi:hypothetical protein
MKGKFWLVLGLIFVVSNIGSAQTANKTITNADLEKFKKKRVQAEKEYRAKYKERGMPSPEELERQIAENNREREALSQRLQQEKQQSQDYWQSMAGVLRNELININAQIDYVNTQLAGMPSGNQIYLRPGQISSGGVIGYGYGYGRRGAVRPRTVVRPNDSIRTVTNAAAGNPNPFYGTPYYQNGIKSVIGPDIRNYRRDGSGRYRVYGGYYLPYVADSNSSNRDELVLRLQQLEQAKAGLLAQWNTLVSDAHRAGVKISF